MKPFEGRKHYLSKWNKIKPNNAHFNRLQVKDDSLSKSAVTSRAVRVGLSCEIKHEMLQLRTQLSARESSYLVTFLHGQQENVFF